MAKRLLLEEIFATATAVDVSTAAGIDTRNRFKQSTNCHEQSELIISNGLDFVSPEWMHGLNNISFFLSLTIYLYI